MVGVGWYRFPCPRKYNPFLQTRVLLVAGRSAWRIILQICRMIGNFQRQRWKIIRIPLLKIQHRQICRTITSTTAGRSYHRIGQRVSQLSENFPNLGYLHFVRQWTKLVDEVSAAMINDGETDSPSQTTAEW